jgi:hypothetical protein
MTTTDLALLEDSTASHEMIRAFMNSSHGVDGAFRLVDSFSQKITEENSAEFLARLRAYERPLAIILDLDLYAAGSLVRVRAMNAFRAVTDRLKRQMNTMDPLEAAGLDKNIRTLEAGFGHSDFVPDGLEFALATIENKRISPLAIWVATRVRAGVHAAEFFNAYARMVRGSNASCKSIFIDTTSMTELTGHPDTAEADLSFYMTRFSRMIEQLYDPRLKIEAYLDNPLIFHPDPHQIGAVKELLMSMLSIGQKSFEDKLWPFLSKHALEMAKSSGTGRPYLSAVAAWFYALLAYLESDNGRLWTDIFEPANLKDFDSDHGYRITPDLGTMESPEGSVRKAALHYYDLCIKMFRNEKSDEGLPGPLLKVKLSNELLAFRLSYDAWVQDGRTSVGDLTSGSLIEKVARWRDAYLKNREGLPQQWANDKGPNCTARAILDWLITCSMNDASLCKNDKNLVRKRFWRMRLQGTPGIKGETEVIFSE